MRPYKKNSFTLVEIVLALGIVALALVAILALITHGLKDSKDSISDNYIADISEQFLHYFSGKAKSDWEDYIGDASSGYIKTSKDVDTDDMTGWSELPVAGTNIYSIKDYQIYGIKQGTSKITDFIGVIRLWKSPVTSQIYSGNGWYDQTDSSYEHSAGLNIEISWPGEIPYSSREKKYFYMEVFKPN
jgi:type II secretory pathway pseudopilin PulG